MVYMSIEVIIFYILLLDSVFANLFAWTSGRRWYRRNFSFIARYFPLKRVWTTYYLVLVLFIGWVLRVYGALEVPFLD